MFRRDLLSAVALGVAVAGCNDDPPDGGRNETVDEDDDDEDQRVRIADHELERRDAGTEEETVAVVGTLERLDDADLNYVEVSARFYDAEEERLDSTTERVEELDDEADEWPFEVVSSLEGEGAAAVDSYDVSITTVL